MPSDPDPDPEPDPATLQDTYSHSQSSLLSKPTLLFALDMSLKRSEALTFLDITNNQELHVAYSRIKKLKKNSILLIDENGDGYKLIDAKFKRFNGPSYYEVPLFTYLLLAWVELFTLNFFAVYTLSVHKCPTVDLEFVKNCLNQKYASIFQKSPCLKEQFDRLKTAKGLKQFFESNFSELSL